MAKFRGGNVQPVIILMLSFIVLVAAVLVFLWRDQGYYKETLNKYADVIVTQGVWKKSFDEMEKAVAQNKVVHQNLQKEIDTLTLAFQNLYTELTLLKKEPPKPLVISPIEISIVKKPPAPKLKPFVKREPIMKTNRVREEVKKAKQNGRGL